jgi:hypothetical protein
MLLKQLIVEVPNSIFESCLNIRYLSISVSAGFGISANVQGLAMWRTLENVKPVNEG